MIPTITLDYSGEQKYTASEIASVIAHSDSDFQGKFFNNMALEFRIMSNNSDKDGMQMLFIRDTLTKDGKEFITKLAEYVNLAE